MNCFTPQPMFSQEAEQSVLGSLLLDSRSWDSICELVVEQDFFDEAHRKIFRCIGLMHAQNQPVDVVTVAEALDVAGDGQATGGLAYLGELAANTPSTANVRRYAEIVVDRRLMRDLLRASNAIADLARAAGTERSVDRIEKAQSLLLALNQQHRDDEPQGVSSLLGRVIETIEARTASRGALSGLRTGFTDLDRLTHGLQKGDLIIVAGRPSMGKTAWALNVAENVALDGGAVLVFSLEMSRDQLVERSLASVGGISMNAIRSGVMNDDAYPRLSCALGKLSKSRLIIDDSPALPVERMRSRARRVAQKHGLDLVIVDYIQLMTGDGLNRNEQIGHITRNLKLLARDLNIPLIALSQLSRDVEKRPDKRPMMSDLRDSGSIEQDADLVLMAYRDEYYNPESAYKGLAELLVRKHRMGELGDIHLIFQGEFSRFRDADPEVLRRAREASQPSKPFARRLRNPADE